MDNIKQEDIEDICFSVSQNIILPKFKNLSEDDLYKLELDSFMRLIETKQTQDRIKHTLLTGKPLVN